MPKPWDEATFDPDEGESQDSWEASWSDVQASEFEFGLDYADEGLSVFVRPRGVTDWDQEIPDSWVLDHIPEGLQDQVMESTFVPDDLDWTRAEAVDRMLRRGFIHNPELDDDHSNAPTLEELGQVHSGPEGVPPIRSEQAEEFSRQLRAARRGDGARPSGVAEATARLLAARAGDVAGADPWVAVTVAVLGSDAYPEGMTAEALVVAVQARLTVVHTDVPGHGGRIELRPLQGSDRALVEREVVLAISRGPFISQPRQGGLTRYRVEGVGAPVETAGLTVAEEDMRDEEAGVRALVFDYERMAVAPARTRLAGPDDEMVDYAGLERRFVAGMTQRAEVEPADNWTNDELDTVVLDQLGRPRTAAEIYDLISNQVRGVNDISFGQVSDTLDRLLGDGQVIEAGSNPTTYRVPEEGFPEDGARLADEMVELAPSEVAARRVAAGWGSGMTAEALGEAFRGFEARGLLPHQAGEGPPPGTAGEALALEVRGEAEPVVLVEAVELLLRRACDEQGLEGLTAAEVAERLALGGLLEIAGVSRAELQRVVGEVLEADDRFQGVEDVDFQRWRLWRPPPTSAPSRAQALGMAIEGVLRGQGALTAADIRTQLVDNGQPTPPVEFREVLGQMEGDGRLEVVGPNDGYRWMTTRYRLVSGSAPRPSRVGRMAALEAAIEGHLLEPGLIMTASDIHVALVRGGQVGHPEESPLLVRDTLQRMAREGGLEIEGPAEPREGWLVVRYRLAGDRDLEDNILRLFRLTGGGSMSLGQCYDALMGQGQGTPRGQVSGALQSLASAGRLDRVEGSPVRYRLASDSDVEDGLLRALRATGGGTVSVDQGCNALRSQGRAVSRDRVAETLGRLIQAGRVAQVRGDPPTYELVSSFEEVVEAVQAEAGIGPVPARGVLRRMRELMVDGEARTEPQLMNEVSAPSQVVVAVLRHDPAYTTVNETEWQWVDAPQEDVPRLVGRGTVTQGALDASVLGVLDRHATGRSVAEVHAELRLPLRMIHAGEVDASMARLVQAGQVAREGDPPTYRVTSLLDDGRGRVAVEPDELSEEQGQPLQAVPLWVIERALEGVRPDERASTAADVWERLIVLDLIDEGMELSYVQDALNQACDGGHIERVLRSQPSEGPETGYRLRRPTAAERAVLDAALESLDIDPRALDETIVDILDGQDSMTAAEVHAELVHGGEFDLSSVQVQNVLSRLLVEGGRVERTQDRPPVRYRLRRPAAAEEALGDDILRAMREVMADARPGDTRYPEGVMNPGDVHGWLIDRGWLEPGLESAHIREALVRLRRMGRVESVSQPRAGFRLVSVSGLEGGILGLLADQGSASLGAIFNALRRTGFGTVSPLEVRVAVEALREAGRLQAVEAMVGDEVVTAYRLMPRLVPRGAAVEALRQFGQAIGEVGESLGMSEGEVADRLSGSEALLDSIVSVLGSGWGQAPRTVAQVQSWLVARGTVSEGTQLLHIQSVMEGACQGPTARLERVEPVLGMSVASTYRVRAVPESTFEDAILQLFEGDPERVLTFVDIEAMMGPRDDDILRRTLAGLVRTGRLVFLSDQDSSGYRTRVGAVRLPTRDLGRDHSAQVAADLLAMHGIEALDDVIVGLIEAMVRETGRDPSVGDILAGFARYQGEVTLEQVGEALARLATAGLVEPDTTSETYRLVTRDLRRHRSASLLQLQTGARDPSFAAYVQRVLAGKSQMTLRGVVEGLQAAGWESPAGALTLADVEQYVSQRLLRMEGVEEVSPLVYRLKPKGPPSVWDRLKSGGLDL